MREILFFFLFITFLWPFYLIEWLLSYLPTATVRRIAMFVSVAYSMMFANVVLDMKNNHWAAVFHVAPVALAVVLGGALLFYIAYTYNKSWPMVPFFFLQLFGIALIQGNGDNIKPGPSYRDDFFYGTLLFALSYILFFILRKRWQVAPPKVTAVTLSQAAVPINQPRKATITFQDIYGMEDAKRRLKKAGLDIAGPQTHATNSKPRPETDKPASLRNGIMLFGGPGNGKTAFAEALAGELGLPILTMTYGDVASKWVNQTTEQVIQFFKDARMSAPCVLFMDEIDSLIPSREAGSGGYEEAQRTTNAILTEIVNLRGSGVVLIAATNFMDRLDKAAIREGRFDYKIEVTAPDETARMGILTQSLEKNLLGVHFEPEIIKRAADRWAGFSVKRIQAVGEELGDMQEETPVTGTFEDLMAAMRRLQGHKGNAIGPAKSLSELVLDNDLREQLATIAIRFKNIETVEKMGGSVPSGILFLGPPGTGKTETARALAKESGFAFLSETGNGLMSNPGRLDKLVEDAKNLRPCIVFIDEADDVLANRVSSFGGSSVTNNLLIAMDGVGGKIRDLVFIAATNHPERIDTAALRGGRFTEKVIFSLPDEGGVVQFVNNWIRKSPAKFDPELFPVKVSELLEGESIANIGAILQEAVNRMIGRSVSGGDNVVCLEDILKARSAVSLTR